MTVIAFQMVPYEATRISLFLMLYGREAIMPEEIDHTVLASKTDYEKSSGGQQSQDFEFARVVK